MDDEPRLASRWERRQAELDRADEERREVERGWERAAERRRRAREHNETVQLLEQRIAVLERDNSELRAEVGSLRTDLHEIAAATSTAIETVGDAHFDLNKDTRDQIRTLQIETAKLRETFAEWREARAEARGRIADDGEIIHKVRVN
jgi:hypothetical protein